MSEQKLRPSKGELTELVNTVSDLIRKKTGNIISNAQLSMVEARLSRRMIELGRLSASEYLQYIKENSKEEEIKLIGLLTTHHTHFFREFIQFETLERELPALVSAARKRGSKELRIWSAACSRGQEVYSLAMFLRKKVPAVAADFSFRVFGSDVDPESVRFAENGVYRKREIREVPMAFLEGGWARGTGTIADYVKASKDLRKHCEFKVANLLDLKTTFRGQMFDVIFCRNVFIYFEQKAIISILNNMFPLLHPNGLFFSGLSESLSQMGLAIESVGPNIYIQKIGAKLSQLGSVAAKDKELPSAVAVEMPVQPVAKVWKMPKPIRLLVVDDSKTVHTIMKKIFHNDPDFRIVGHAMNGLEAEAFLKDNQVDSVTLDIHMPEMDGLTYLEKNFSSKHPPVVMVSSANRDDASTALKSLRLGASDFVEKPSLQNLGTLTEEIKNKIKMSLMYSSSGPSQVDRDFAKADVIKDPQDCLRVVFLDLPQLEKLRSVWNAFSGKQPPVVVVPMTHGVFSNAFLSELETANGVEKVDVWTKDSKMACAGLYVAEMSELQAECANVCKDKQVSVLCFGPVSASCIKLIKSLKGAQVLVEEVPGVLDHDTSFATDIFPITSFACISSQFFSMRKAA
ncbi:response regulator [bacterium]|nr:response regulator [bacterium]